MSNLKRVFLILVSVGSMSMFTACGNSATVPQASNGSGGIAAVNGMCTTAPYLTMSNGYCYSSTTTNPTNGGSIATVNGQCTQSPYLTLMNGQCYSNNGGINNPINPINPINGPGMCSLGSVKTQYGCLPQGACPQGFGFGYWGGQPWCFPQTF